MKSFPLTYLWQILLIFLITSLGTGWYYHTRIEGAATLKTGTDNTQADFQADLTHTLDLQKGQGKPAFTRSDGADRRATVTDFEGLIKKVKNGEARFEGARRVENLLGSSEIFNSWTASNVSVNTNAEVSPNGTVTAERITATSANGTITQSSAVVAGTVVFSVYLSRFSGSGTVEISPDGTNWTAVVPSASGWKRFSVSGTVSAGSIAPGVRIVTSGDVIRAWGGQLEDVSGQSNQNPSEYVSTNVLPSAPYHGANVHGVKYFDTENGNTVSNNIITEAEGAKIAEGTLKGIVIENGVTNIAPYSEALNTAASWVPSNMTVTADAAVAPDGHQTAETLTADANNATLIRFGVNSDKLFAIYLKRKTGTGNVDLTCSGGTVWTTVAVTTDWARYHIPWEAATDCGIRLVVSGDEVYAWGAQIQSYSFPFSYTSNSGGGQDGFGRDRLSYPFAQNADLTKGSFTANVTTFWTTAKYLTYYNVYLLQFGSGGSIPLYFKNSPDAGQMGGNDGTARSSTLTFSGSTTSTGVGLSWGGSALSYFLSGSKSSTTFDGGFNDSSYGILFGSSPDGNTNTFTGTVKNVKIWKQAMSDTFLQSLTAGGTAVEKKTTISAGDDEFMADGLVGHWTFDGSDMSGTTAFDRSGQGNNGTIATASFAGGKHGQALSLNGADLAGLRTLSATTADDNMASFTTCAWVYPRSLTNNDGDATIYFINKSWGLYFTNNQPNSLTFWVPTTSAYPIVHSGVDLQTSVWQHICGVFVSFGTAPKMYVNGQDVSTNTSVGSGDRSDDSASALAVGTVNSNPYSGNFNGVIDDVRIYNRALSASEIFVLYSHGQAKLSASMEDALAKGLSGYWKLDDNAASTTTADATGRNNGTATQNTSSMTTTGQIGEAFHFNGTSDYVDAGSVDAYSFIQNTGVFTISLWAKFDSSAVTTQYFMGNTPTSGEKGFYFGLQNQSGSNQIALTLAKGTGGQFVIASNYFNPTIMRTVWNHIVAAGNGSTVTFYVNGIPYAGSGAMGAFSSGSSTRTLHLGEINNHGLERFAGSLDDVRIYDRTLSTEEVSQLYRTTGPTQPIDTSLVGYWSFNGPDVSGTTAFDRSGQGNNGTLSGSVGFPTSAPGRVGQALSFDGVTNHEQAVSVPDPSSGVLDFGTNSPFSLSLWFKTGYAQAQYGAAISKKFVSWGLDTPGYALLVDGTNPFIQFNITDGVNGCSYTHSFSPVVRKTWQHVVVTIDTSRNVVAYLDGSVLSLTPSCIGGAIGSISTSYPFLIGNGDSLGPGSRSYEYGGLVDEVRIYNRVLSATEVAQLYNWGR